MVSLLDIKKDVPNPSSLLAFSSDESPQTTLSFSDLLKGVEVQNGLEALDAKNSPKSQSKEPLLSLLKVVKSPKHAEQKQENSKEISNVTISDLAELEGEVKLAKSAGVDLSKVEEKEFVSKEKIAQLIEKIEQKLPITQEEIKTLVEAAKSLDVDVAKLDVKKLPSKDEIEKLVEKLEQKLPQHAEKIQASVEATPKEQEKIEEIIQKVSQHAEQKEVKLPITQEEVKTLIEAAKSLDVDVAKLDVKKLPSKDEIEKLVEKLEQKLPKHAEKTETISQIVPKEQSKIEDIVQKVVQHAEPKQQDTQVVLESLNIPINREDIKLMIQDAKEYLKAKIAKTPQYQDKDLKELPHTLKGLVEVAKQVGIDVSKITYEQFKTAMPKLQTHSTQEIVQMKNSRIEKVEKKVLKSKADETLQTLLQGSKALKKGSSLTADFSTESARVIAPSVKTEPKPSLESLLQGEEPVEKTALKVDTPQVFKAESLDVKINEAKQMMKYLSHDVKQAIDNYKAPFTRVKVQLNPQNLGDIELTVVQRGKNLHVNLSSNNTAINVLQMNSNDLKVQLQNSGINNATLNFNSGSASGDASGNSQAQHQQQNRQHAQSEYNYFDNEETNEELLSSLEIVVPSYA